MRHLRRVETEALAFALSCAECDVTLTVDMDDARWRDRLGGFGNDHADHRQVIQIPEPRLAS